MARETPTVRGLPSESECAKMGLTCACYNLRRASRAVSQLFDSHFEEVGLKATQFTLLAALAYARTSPPTIGELAETLVLEQSSLSRNLAILERLGLVRIAPGANDRRERIVTLARPGMSAVARGYPIWQKAQAAIASALDTNELDGQLRALRRMTRAAQQLQQPARRRGPQRPVLAARPT